jgi:hypothetical protein
MVINGYGRWSPRMLDSYPNQPNRKVMTMWETRIVTSDPDATHVVVKQAWRMSVDGKHAATIYDQGIMLDWLANGRADSADMGYVYRVPLHSPLH